MNFILVSENLALLHLLDLVSSISQENASVRRESYYTVITNLLLHFFAQITTKKQNTESRDI